ncbi:T9SS type A sorting domain-containing protein [bacterium]|nr:T9SS type A sorting domain-containing protein [bacterium]
MLNHLKTALIVVLFAASLAYSFVPVEKNDQQGNYINLEKPIQIPVSNLVEQDQNWLTFLENSSGSWNVYINPVSSSPHRVVGGQIPLNCRALNSENIEKATYEILDQYKDLFKIEPAQLRNFRCEKIGKIWYVTFWQYYEDYQVYNSHIEIRVNDDGRIFLITNSFKPEMDDIKNPNLTEGDAFQIAYRELQTQADIKEETHHGLMVYPRIVNDEYEYHLAYCMEIYVEDPLGKWEFFIDAHTGEILSKINNLRFFNVEGNVYGMVRPHYAFDPFEERDMPHSRVYLGTRNTYSDGGGYYSFMDLPGSSMTFYVMLQGRYCDVNNDDASDSYYSTVITSEDSPFYFTWTTSYAEEDEINAYYHTTFIHDYVKNVLHYNGMDFMIDCNIRVGNNYSNAYYDGDINFGEGNYSTYNFALFAEIIYHEYTHGVTHHIYPYGSLPYEGESGAMDECFSDYFACSVTGDPDVAEGIYRSDPDDMFRTLENDLVFDDMIDEVHYDGTIIGAAVWDIRELLGVSIADSLVHQARFGFAENFEDYLFEMLAVDDDDGNLSNGTPHAYEILSSFANHEIGPGIEVSIEHTPLCDTEDTSAAYEVEAHIFSYISLEPESTVVYYSIERDTWIRIPMYEDDYNFRASIPSQPSGTTVRYFLKAADIHGLVEYSPPEGRYIPYQFYVGIDTLSPTITHENLPDQSPICWPPKVFAIVTDNLGIDSAFCEYKINGETQPRATLVQVGDSNLYKCNISGDMEPGDVIEYKLFAYDMSRAANHTELPSTEYFTFNIVDDYYQPFEYQYSGFKTYPVTASYGNEWHVSTSRNHTAGGHYSWKCGGSGFSSYDNLLDAALETPFLTIADSAILTFQHRMTAENHSDYASYAWDGGFVEMSTDRGVTWFQIVPDGGYTHLIYNNPASPFEANTPCYSGPCDWAEATFFIYDLPGEILIRFRFGSDGYVTEEGWYIDDIEISTGISSFILDPEQGWLPDKVELSQNYPNPFNSQTSIEYSVPASQTKDTDVSIEVYDIRGRAVKSLFSGKQEAGFHRIMWDGTDNNGAMIPTGIYMYRLRVGDTTLQKKCLLIK